MTAATMVATPKGIRNIAVKALLPLNGFDNKLATINATVNCRRRAAPVTMKVLSMGLVPNVLKTK